MSDVNKLRLGLILIVLVWLGATLKREHIPCEMLKKFTPCTTMSPTK